VKRLAIGLLVLCAVSAGALAQAPRPADARTIQNTVTLTRADGSTIALIQRVRFWCGRWAGDVRTPAIHLRAGDPRGTGGYWSLDAVVADVRRRPVVRFPHSFIFDKPTKALIGGFDRDGGGKEFTTAEEEASGRVTFTTVRCGKRPRLRFRVDAVMGSEFFDGQPVTIRGSFSGRV
jgi:hypothetical protein